MTVAVCFVILSLLLLLGLCDRAGWADEEAGYG